MTRVLIVGAGAVGQVFAYHLVRGGAEVSFLVKPQYAEETRQGFMLHRMGLRGFAKPAPFRGYQVISTQEAAKTEHWDQVWLAIPSTGLTEDWLLHWLPVFADSLIVALQPDLHDHDKLLQHLPAARLVQGMISFVSYHSPLPGHDNDPQGTAYMSPPGGAAALFDARHPASQGIADLLNKGGLSTRTSADVIYMAARASAVMIPLIAALELHDWKLRGITGSSSCTLGTRAASEALAVVAAYHNRSRPLLRLLMQSPLVGTALSLLPLAPFAVEDILHHHFSKVGAQTEQMLQSYIDEGRAFAVPVDALGKLLNELQAQRRQQRTASQVA